MSNFWLVIRKTSTGVDSSFKRLVVDTEVSKDDVVELAFKAKDFKDAFEKMAAYKTRRKPGYGYV